MTDETKNVIVKERMFQESWVMLPKFIMRMTEVSAADKMVFMSLLDRVRNRGRGRCFPAQDLVAHDCGCSIDTVQRSIAKLKEIGFLNWKQRGRSLTCEYVFEDIPAWVFEKYGDDVLKKPETATCGFSETATCGIQKPQLAASRNRNLRYKEYKGEEDEKKNTPSEACAPFSPPTSVGEEPKGPSPSGPDGGVGKELPRVSEKLGDPASDCAETEQNRWWADDIMFSDAGKVEKKPRARGTRTAKAVGGEKQATPVWSLWTHFRRTVEDKWPEMNVPLKPVGREWANLKKMLAEYGEHDVHRIIDVAVADWDAIRESWPTVAKGSVTTFYAVFALRVDLMAAVASGNGVTTRGNRVSEYMKQVNADKPAQLGWGDTL
jgi:hypothetical protein